MFAPLYTKPIIQGAQTALGLNCHASNRLADTWDATDDEGDDFT
jgi:hypothetical protein